MTLDLALLLATMIGQTVGILARFVPFIPNVAIPKLVVVANIAANVVLVAQKFLESVGAVAPGVAWYLPDVHNGLAYAGFMGVLKGLGVFVGASVLGYAQLAFQRFVHEKGIKPVYQDGDSGAL